MKFTFRTCALLMVLWLSLGTLGPLVQGAVADGLDLVEEHPALYKEPAKFYGLDTASW